jgi:hypothetical protein
MIDTTLFELSDNGWLIRMFLMGIWTSMQVLMIFAKAANEGSDQARARRLLAVKQRERERDESAHDKR